jgi:predicted nucleotidyltransferase component of viral defense system
LLTKALSRKTLKALKTLGSAQIMPGAYLAGGTALALHLGHRISVDLDFFTSKIFNEAILARKLERLADFKKEQMAWRTVLGKFMGVKFSCFYYQYRLLEQPKLFEGIAVASKKDIAAMKLLAISDRGTRRDFVDLYFLCKEFSLRQVFNFYDQKFRDLEDKRYHLLRGLSYFADAEDQLELRMLEPVDWTKVKRFFTDQVRILTKDWQ